MILKKSRIPLGTELRETGSHFGMLFCWAGSLRPPFWYLGRKRPNCLGYFPKLSFLGTLSFFTKDFVTLKHLSAPHILPFKKEWKELYIFIRLFFKSDKPQSSCMYYSMKFLFLFLERAGANSIVTFKRQKVKTFF